MGTENNDAKPEQAAGIDKEKGTKAAKLIEKVFPDLIIKVYMEAMFSIITFDGEGPGYRFVIRVKRVDYDRSTAETLAEAYIEKLSDLQKNKDKSDRLKRK